MIRAFLLALITLTLTSVAANTQDCNTNGLPDTQELGPFPTSVGGVELTPPNSQMTAGSTSFSLANQSFTTEAWVYREAATGLGEYILFNGIEGVVNNGLVIGFRATGQFTFAFWGNDLETPATYPPDGQWHHWACRYDASNGSRWIFRDGVEVAFDVASNFVGNGPLTIGGLPTRTEFHGTLDEIRIWSGLRSDAQITQDMSIQYNDGSIPAGLLAYYRANAADANDPAKLPDLAGAGGNPVIAVDGQPLTILGYSSDCNGNGVPDECDIASGFSNDCNGNGVPDDCDLANGTSQDCNGNGVPDECDIASGFSNDCNGNGVPDDCDFVNGTSQDCNGNGVPDECETDCNGNGIPDECDIANGTSIDSNGDGRPDECDAVENVTQGTYYSDLQYAIDQSNNHDVLELAPIDHGVGQDGIFIFQRSLTIRGRDANNPDVVRATRVATDNGVSVGLDIGQSVIFEGVSPSSVLLSSASLNTDIIFDRCWIEPSSSQGIGIAIIDLDGRLAVHNSTIANAPVGLTMNGGSSAPTIDIIQSRIVNCKSGVFIDGDLLGRTNGVTPTVSINHSLITVDPSSGFPSGVNIFNTSDGSLLIANSIVRGPVTPDSTVFVTYANSNLQGIVGDPGSGVIDADPLFVDEDGADNDLSTIEDNDYRLTGASPSVDTGSSAFTVQDEFDVDGDGDVTELLPLDFEGNTRVVGGTVDMGPYEYQGPPPCPADLTGDGQLNFFDVSAFLSAFAANDPAADFTGEGQFNFFDVSAFLTAFSAGCP